MHFPVTVSLACVWSNGQGARRRRTSLRGTAPRRCRAVVHPTPPGDSLVDHPPSAHCNATPPSGPPAVQGAAGARNTNSERRRWSRRVALAVSGGVVGTTYIQTFKPATHARALCNTRCARLGDPAKAARRGASLGGDERGGVSRWGHPGVAAASRLLAPCPAVLARCCQCPLLRV